MATAEFSKFSGVLSAALSQHNLLGFEVAQLEFFFFNLILFIYLFILLYNLVLVLPPLALFVVILSKAHLTSHSRMSASR